MSSIGIRRQAPCSDPKLPRLLKANVARRLAHLIHRIAGIRETQLYNALNPRIDLVSRPPRPPDHREFRFVRTVWSENPPPFGFPAIERKKVVAGFDGGRITSDGGVLLLGAVERQLGIADRLAPLISDPRNPLYVTHSVSDILRARMLAIACGYASCRSTSTTCTGRR